MDPSVAVAAEEVPDGPPVAEGGESSDRSGWLRHSKLGLACLGLFLACWLAQSLTGWRVYSGDRLEHGLGAVSYGKYLSSGHFVEATFENWESEFLQMASFVFLTMFLLQKGSPESKSENNDPRDEDPESHRHDPGAPWPVRKGGLWLKLYKNSLLAAFVLLFLISFIGHALGGDRLYNEEQKAHGSPPVSTLDFMRTGEFWFQSFENWQSEFLAVGSIVVLTIFLRQKGSSESKPVHAPHSAS